jgi:hypothetical protein
MPTRLPVDFVRKKLADFNKQAIDPSTACAYLEISRYVDDLWQHTSSNHQWWPAPAKQTLLLTTDDCSGLYVAGRFVDRDTTWNHFELFWLRFPRHL